MLAAVCSSNSARRAASTTSAPCSASTWAVARPMPVPLPVTIATRPSSENISSTIPCLLTPAAAGQHRTDGEAQARRNKPSGSAASVM